MSVSVKFDNTEIVNTTYTTRFVKHDSATRRILTKLELAREDGSVLISDRRGEKNINCQGYLAGTSEADLESKIDLFKELFSRQEKDLDILRPAGGTTRRYVATCLRHNFNRDHFHLLFVPWTAEFVVLTGEGKDTSETVVIDEALKAVATPYTGDFAIAGSKPAKPTIKMVLQQNWADIKGIQWENLDTGEKIIITKDINWNIGNYVEINCNDRTVRGTPGGITLDDLRFYGMFPTHLIGTNNYKITAGGIVCQQHYKAAGSITSHFFVTAAAKYRAQSFEIPYSDETFQGVSLALRKTGAPGNLTWRIETDNNGEPSGNYAVPAAPSEGTILAGDIGGTTVWLTSYANNPFALEANTRYWLVLRFATPSAGNYISVGQDTGAGYPNGFFSASDDSGVSWTPDTTKDMYFQLRFGGEPQAGAEVDLTVSYKKTYL